MSNQRKGKEPQTEDVDDRDRDATMAPTVTEPIFHYLSDDDLEDPHITNKLSTAGSFQINDWNPMDPRDLVHEAILEKVRNEEPIITNEERIEDDTLQLTTSGGQMITSTKREELFSKTLTKSDLNRCIGGGLRLPLKLVRGKILRHISAPADGGEGKPLTLVDHKGKKWDMLFVLQSYKYYLRGKWYRYAEKYKLKVSDTIIIEKISISKEQVKEVVDFAAVNKIGDHDWDTSCEDQQIETKDIGKAEVAYEITIERGPATEQEHDGSGDEE